MKALAVSTLASLVLLIPGHSRATNVDPIINNQFSSHSVSKLTEPLLKPQTALETALHELKPFGTYLNLYAYGNCTAGVASRLPIPNNWGNANNWAYSALSSGYTVSSVPKVGAIAQTGGDSWLGHVGVVVGLNPNGSFTVWEENFDGLGMTDTRNTTTAEFPNFIYF